MCYDDRNFIKISLNYYSTIVSYSKPFHLLKVEPNLLLKISNQKKQAFHLSKGGAKQIIYLSKGGAKHTILLIPYE